ncbi:MAG: CHAD domain-containing protein [Nocardiaceae bacterium]|nr:CHAD domain-containing protein [Nocardiaceae bacterium]
MKSKTTAGSALLTALRSDVDRLIKAEPDVIADKYDSIHQMRVATRRLRSVMRSYKKILPGDASKELRNELKWLAGLLGEARDAEVLAERFQNLLDLQPDGLAQGPVYDRLVGAQRRRYADAHEGAVKELGGDRYRALRARLEELSIGRLDTTLSEAPAEKIFLDCLTRDYERVRDDVRMQFAASPEDRIEALHDVRKSSKALRYSGEAATGVLGEAAAQVASAAKSLQTVLGDWRDAAEAQAHIMDVAAQARAAGEDLFVYGVLHHTEGMAAENFLAGYRPALDVLTTECAVLR